MKTWLPLDYNQGYLWLIIQERPSILEPKKAVVRFGVTRQTLKTEARGYAVKMTGRPPKHYERQLKTGNLL